RWRPLLRRRLAGCRRLRCLVDPRRLHRRRAVPPRAPGHRAPVGDPGRHPGRTTGVSTVTALPARPRPLPPGRSRTLVAVPPPEAHGGDAVLLARLAAGDERALGIVYDQHADMVYGLARRVTRDDHLAREITQEVFTYLWSQPDRVDLERGSLRAF